MDELFQEMLDKNLITVHRPNYYYSSGFWEQWVAGTIDRDLFIQIWQNAQNMGVVLPPNSRN